MMRSNAVIAAEFVSICGVPALAMDNTIKLSRGLLGVDEPCSGIRSLAASGMVHS